MNKLIKLTPLILLLTLTLIPLAHATETVYYQSDTTVAYWYSWQPDVENETFVGEGFQANNQYVTRATWYLKNDSTTESGSIRAILIHVNYTGGCYLPLNDEQPIAFSNNTYNLASLTAPTFVTFYFSTDNLLNSATSDYWGVALERVTDAASTVKMACTSTSEQDFFYDSEGDRHFTYHPYGAYLTVYTDDGLGGPTATPAPSPTTIPSNTEDTINTFTNYLIPLILFLLPALILGWLTHWEKWPILIGLAIGSGLTYLFMGTDYLWLVVLVIIGIGASAYQSSRTG